jgi:hypothetical protein
MPQSTWNSLCALWNVLTTENIASGWCCITYYWPGQKKCWKVRDSGKMWNGKLGTFWTLRLLFWKLEKSSLYLISVAGHLGPSQGTLSPTHETPRLNSRNTLDNHSTRQLNSRNTSNRLSTPQSNSRNTSVLLLELSVQLTKYIGPTHEHLG